MYGLDKYNRIAQISPLAKYDSKENILKSLDLPLPKKDKLLITNQEKLRGLNYYNLDDILEQILLHIKGTDIEQELKQYKKEGLKQELKYIDGELVSVEVSEEKKLQIDLMDVELDIMDISNYININLDLLNLLLRTINDSQHQIYTTNLDLAELINKHQLYTPSKTAYQNKITRNIYKSSHNILNLEYSIQPMSNEECEKNIDKVTDFAKEHGYTTKSKMNVDPHDPTSIGIVREQNGMGKVEVGVFANGIKVNSTLQQYFNIHLNARIKPLNLTFNFKDLNPQHLENYNKFITLVENKTITNLANTLASKQLDNTQENVADKLSSLISLATDNAKELKLYIMNSTPELAKAYISLFTLGYTWEEALRIGMILFEPIIEEMKTNRLYKASDTDVYGAIQKCLDKNIFDEVTANSLIEVFKFADEITGLSAFFKINQGVVARYEESINFSKNIGKLLEDLKKKAGNNLTEKEKQYLSKPFNLYLFCNDANYRQVLIEFNEKYKTVVNSFEVIYNTPHFFSQAKAYAETLFLLNSISLKAGFIDYNAKPQIKTDRNLEEEQDKKSKTKNSIRFDRMKLKNQLVIPEHAAIDYILQRLPKYTFTIKDLKDYIKENSKIEFKRLSKYPDNFIIDLSTNIGTSIFVEMMNDYIINIMKELYPNNNFLLRMVKKENIEFKKDLYDLNISFFDLDEIDQYNTKNLILSDFINDLVIKDSGLRNVNGKPITFGELLYLYNLIVYRNKLGGLNIVTRTVLEYNPNLNFLDLYIEAYNNLGELNNLDEEQKDILFTKMQDLLKISNESSKRGKYDQTGLMLDLSNAYVYFQETTENEYDFDSQDITLEEYIQSIKELLEIDHNIEIDINCL